MSTAAPARSGTARADAPGPSGPTSRPSRATLGWAGLFVLLCIALGVVGVLAPERVALPTDPDNPRAEGSRAVAQVLRERLGVDVEAVRSRAEFDAAALDASTTLLVTPAADLSGPAADALARRSREAGRVVLVGPSQVVLDRLGLPARLAVPGPPLPTESRCDTADVGPGEWIAAPSLAYRPDGPAEVCFPAEESEGDDAAAGGYVALPAVASRAPTVLLGDDALLTNDGVTANDHAAIALRTLSHGTRVLWYVPADAEEPPLVAASAAPGWFGPSAVLVLLALGVVALWRGRRFGRLVTEPLPALVPAAETTHARARLYGRARDPGHAWRLLRDAAAERWRTALALPPAATLEEVAAAAADALGHPTVEVSRLLHETPRTDADLLTAARRLRRLDTEVRHR